MVLLQTAVFVVVVEAVAVSVEACYSLLETDVAKTGKQVRPYSSYCFPYIGHLHRSWSAPTHFLAEDEGPYWQARLCLVPAEPVACIDWPRNWVYFAAAVAAVVVVWP